MVTRRQSLARVLAPALALLLGSLVPARTLAQARALDAEVERLVSTRKLGNAVVGVCLRDSETGQMLAGVREATPLIPASNMKILTSGAALLVLSPQFQFRTEVVALDGRLYVRGSGDPALADPEVLDAMRPKITVSDVLATIARAVKDADVTGLREVVVDDRVFDRDYVPAGWSPDRLDKGYAAPVCGLNFHANVLHFFPRPGDSIGGTPVYSIQPDASWLSVENKARTTAAGKNSVWLSRVAGTNRFTLHGDVRFPVQVGVEITTHEPARLFGQLLAASLNREGVPVAGGGGLLSNAEPQGVRLAEPDDPRTGGRVVAVINTPVAEVLRRCNTDSANLYAEALLKRMGHAVTGEPGSWANGAAVLRMMLAQKLGPEAAASVTIADGSGLARENAVSPAVLARWLDVLARDPATRDVFSASLASPGEGTLKSRFQGAKLRNQVHAKSGYINGVRSLSGYVVSPSTGRRVSFAIIVNNVSDAQAAAAKDLHEDIVRLADRWLSDRTEPTRPGG